MEVKKQKNLVEIYKPQEEGTREAQKSRLKEGAADFILKINSWFQHHGQRLNYGQLDKLSIHGGGHLYDMSEELKLAAEHTSPNI